MVSKRKVLQEGFCGVGCSPIAPALIVDGVLRLVLLGQWAGLVAGLQPSL
jgi:hypothetical protein